MVSLQGLGPRARKAVLSGDTSDVRATIELGPAAKWDDLAAAIAEIGGTVNFHDAASRLVSVELCPARLDAIASVPGVVYVEIGDRLQRDEPETGQWWDRLLS
ncbi:MAG: hypothetical protein WBM50_21330 [Acidimicrobiales bacterium]